MPTFNDILMQHTEMQSVRHPFGAEYAALNTLKSLFLEPESELKTIQIQAARTHFTSEEHFSPCLKGMHEKYLRSLDQSNAKFDTDQFIHYLLATVSLPDEYTIETASDAAFHFPSSPTHKVKQNVFAHIERYSNEVTGRLLSSEVPHRNSYNNAPSHQPIKRIGETESSQIIEPTENEDRAASQEINNPTKETDSFLEMIWDNEITHIIVLGENQDRVDYCNTETALFKTTLNFEDGSFSITNKKTNESRIIKRTCFSVEDNQSLEDTEINTANLLMLHEEYKKNNMLVHCDSGVGRTGQIRLLFALLDEYDSSNSRLKNAFDTLEQILSSPENEGNLDKKEEVAIETQVDCVFKTFSETLDKLRKTRYCVQTIEQFNGIFDLLYSVIALKNEKALELDQPEQDQSEVNQAGLFATLGNKPPMAKEAKTQLQP